MGTHRKDAELWVMEADFWYVVGASRGDEAESLEKALTCYDQSLRTADTLSARRMKAETLLRLRRYAEAFQVFGQVCQYEATWQELEAAPFRLRHDAELVDRLATLGRLARPLASEISSLLRHVAAHIDEESGLNRPRISDLPFDDVSALRRARFDELWRLAPYPVEWAGSEVLNPAVDWTRADEDYAQSGVVVIDDFFSSAALEELWKYALSSPNFRTTRQGFLGAFPADGFVHPIVLSTAVALEQRMPRTMAGHPLGLWWLFKYTSASPRGIGIHADAAAVNVNVWLTPDQARVSGGGLDIFTVVPPDEGDVSGFNREFQTAAEEHELRMTLEAGGTRRVEYRQNRAAIFVSDRFHVSQPFNFPDPDAPRVNFTLLFGDRPQRQAPHDAATCVKAEGHNAEDAWDLFD